jgi:hypothetical protein
MQSRVLSIAVSSTANYHPPLSFFLRLIGTVAGSVAGIVVWEICQGVTYAIAVLMFIVNYVLYHLFFFKPFWRVCILMSQITMLLVGSVFA